MSRKAYDQNTLLFSVIKHFYDLVYPQTDTNKYIFKSGTYTF